jgi:hypothetical protein
MKLLTPFKNASLLTAPNNDVLDLVNQYISNVPQLEEYLGETVTLGIGMITVCKEMFNSRLCYVEGELFYRNVRSRKTNPWVRDSKHFSGLLVWFRNACFLDKMTTPDIKVIVELCLETGLIPEKTKQEFEDMINPWKDDPKSIPDEFNQ